MGGRTMGPLTAGDAALCCGEVGEYMGLVPSDVCVWGGGGRGWWVGMKRKKEE